MKDGVDSTATEGMRELYGLPMRLTVHHPKINVIRRNKTVNLTFPKVFGPQPLNESV